MLLKFSEGGGEKADLVSNVFYLNPSRHDPGQKEKINLNFYFHTSLWCLKRNHKEVCKKKFKLTFTLVQLSEMQGAGRVNT